MPEPKISRRCPTCQTAIRDLAFFCPECGNKLDPPSNRQPEQPGIHDTQEDVVDAGMTMTEADFRRREDVLDGNMTMTEADFRARESSAPTIVETRQPEPSAPVQRPSRPGGSKLQRVTNKARDVEGDVKQRVQKYRDISTAVIDEASYDPSLRFVLVAAGLFVLFLIIVLLNKLIG